MSKIHGKLYLGTYVEACDKKWLKEHRITHILICATEISPHFENGKKYNYKKLPMIVVETFDPIPCFDEAADWILDLQENKKCKGILVHDYLGDSRGVTCVLAYIMKHLGYAYDHAFKELLERRHQSRIDPYYKKCIKIWGFEHIKAKNRLKFMKEYKQSDLVNFKPSVGWKDQAGE